MGDQTVDIQREGHPTRAGQAIARLAARQHGVVSAAQLRSLGVGEGAVRWRIQTGRLHRVHRGVYSVGHRLLSLQGRYMAALLACGPQAVLSHRSAAGMWDLRRNSTWIEVTVPRSRKRIEGVSLHRSRMMDESDFTLA